MAVMVASISAGKATSLPSTRDISLKKHMPKAGSGYDLSRVGGRVDMGEW